MQTRNCHYVGWLVVAAALAAAPSMPPSTATAPVPPAQPNPTRPPAPTPAEPRIAQSSQDEEPSGQAESSDQETPPFEFALRGENKCVIPYTHGDAKTEEGSIEVTPEDNTLTVTMTGGVGANVFLGLHSEAVQTFRLIQEIEVTSSDPSIREMILTLDSKLVGFVRSKHKASACVRLASLTVTPIGSATPILSISHPLPCVGGGGGLCTPPMGSQSKDPLPAIKSQTLPLGAYVIDANFLLTATADGFLDAHSTAIFSPEPEELDPWEREHDPFAGEDKEGYGFTSVITATAVGAEPVASEKIWKTLKKRLAKEKREKRLAKQADPRLAAKPSTQPLFPQARNLPVNAPERVVR